MEIKVERLNNANAKAEAKISNETISQKEDKIVKSVAKDMKIDGFRQGKVPTSLVKSRYKDKIEQDAKSEAIRDIYEQALKDLEIAAETIIGEPNVVKFDESDNGIDVEIKIAVRPEISIEGYKEAIPAFEEPEVSDDEIKERIDAMLKSSAGFKKVEEDRALKNGDFALIDFEGSINGELFEGGSAQGHNLEIGSGSFIPGFEDQMDGMKVDEVKDVTVNFPQEYQVKDLAGKEAVFKVTLLEIQEKDIPVDLDAETLTKLMPNEESPTEDLLKEQIKDQIKREKLNQLYIDELKPQFVETIVEKFIFDLPENIVEQEIDLAFRNSLSALKEEEIKEYSENPDKVKEKREEFRKDSEDSVKLTFLVDELAKAEEVAVSDQEVMQTIYYEAFQTRQDPQEYLEQYEKQGLLPAVKMAMIEDRLFIKLFDGRLKGE